MRHGRLQSGDAHASDATALATATLSFGVATWGRPIKAYSKKPRQRPDAGARRPDSAGFGFAARSVCLRQSTTRRESSNADGSTVCGDAEKREEKKTTAKLDCVRL
ncbi:hypothetical protein HPB50_004585 [Hyalomma asiaticum]|uniref:Uncharacterized protein n=1 Tax=Hyalomma asiaticum TaxID=266040 RepID=A0ACB7TF56_HYAAI|nr:hypothetical protein HPB50_004585 [Hyalomma asiaticum]